MKFVVFVLCAVLCGAALNRAAAEAPAGTYADKNGKTVLEIRSEGSARALFSIGTNGAKREGSLNPVSVDALLCSMLFPGQRACNGMTCEVADPVLVCDLSEAQFRSTVQPTLGNASVFYVRGSGAPVPLRKK